MPIQVTCKCGKQFQTKDENAGRRARCPECGTDLIIPNSGGGGVADVTDNPYLAPPPGPGAAQWVAPRTSGKAIASLVLGIFAFFCTIFTGIPAIILGALGLSDIKKSRGAIGGQGLAIAGIVTGSLGCAWMLILVALMIPAITAATAAAQRAQCTNNLKMIGLAMQNYHSVHNVLPPAWTVSPDGKPLLSWRVLLLPFLDQNSLYEQFKLDEPWDSPTNKPLLARMPDVFQCPSFSDTTTDKSIYQVLIGPGTLFEKTEGTSFGDVTDGTVNTLMVVESKLPLPWTQPEGLKFTPKTPIQGIGSVHPGGFDAAFADGSVKFLKNTLPPSTLEALVTRNGGEVVDSGQF